MTDEADHRQKDLRRRTARGILWLFGKTGVITIAKLAFLMILARLLMPEEFGLAAMASVFATFASGISRLGVSPAIVQHPALCDEHCIAGFQIGIALGVLCAAAIFFSADPISHFVAMDGLAPLLQIAALVPLIAAFGQVSVGTLERHLRFKELALIDGGAYLVSHGLIAVPLAMAGYGAEALIWGIVAAAAVKTGAELMLSPPRVAPSAPLKFYREILRFGLGASAADLANATANNIDNVIIGKFLGAAALGIYSRAFQVVTMPTKLFGESLSKALFPAMSAVQGDQARLSAAFFQTLGVMAMLTLPFSAFLIVAAPEIVWVLLGAQWGEVVIPFQLLALAILPRVATSTCGALIRAKGAVYRHALRKLIYSALVALGAYGGSHYGLNGAALGVALAIMVNFLVMLDFALTLAGAGRGSALRVMGRHVLLALILAVGLWLLAEALRDQALHPILVLGSLGLGAGISALLVALVFPTAIGDEAQHLSKILRKLRPNEMRVR